MEFFLFNVKQLLNRQYTTILLLQMHYWEDFKITDHKHRFWILKIIAFLVDVGYSVKLLIEYTVWDVFMYFCFLSLFLKKFDPRNTHEKNFWTNEIPMKANWHDSTRPTRPMIARDPRNLAHWNHTGTEFSRSGMHLPSHLHTHTTHLSSPLLERQPFIKFITKNFSFRDICLIRDVFCE